MILSIADTHAATVISRDAKIRLSQVATIW
jgi:hypothetical protein